MEDRRGHSHLCAARSNNGVDGWTIDAEPTLRPDRESFPEELWGIEDPRITFVEELGKYAVADTAFSREAPEWHWHSLRTSVTSSDTSIALARGEDQPAPPVARSERHGLAAEVPH